MTSKQSKAQQGLALFAALLIIAVFAIMGLTAVKKAKENEQIAGAEVRYGAVFEAAEQTLRQAVKYLNAIDGIPKAGDGSANIAIAKNFDVEKAKNKNNDFRRGDTFIWSKDNLRNKLNSLCKDNACDGFVEEIDNNAFWKIAVPSTFTEGIAENNYLNHIETYTFVEELKSTSISTAEPVFGGKTLDAGGNHTEQVKKKSFYLITVKASGFPPNINRNAQNARENIVIQSVFVKID